VKKRYIKKHLQQNVSLQLNYNDNLNRYNVFNKNIIKYYHRKYWARECIKDTNYLHISKYDFSLSLKPNSDNTSYFPSVILNQRVEHILVCVQYLLVNWFCLIFYEINKAARRRVFYYIDRRTRVLLEIAANVI
jgi:hypothetical protein